jgi:hypothetical protein
MFERFAGFRAWTMTKEGLGIINIVTISSFLGFLLGVVSSKMSWI